jgi:cytochrome P450
VHAVISNQGSPVDGVDLSDLEFWAGAPHRRFEAFARLRRDRPIAFFDEPIFDNGSDLVHPTGRGYWAVTRHADVTEVTRNPDLFCSGKGALSIVDLPQELVDYFTGMVSTDKPRHARLRGIVSSSSPTASSTRSPTAGSATSPPAWPPRCPSRSSAT